MDTTNCTSSTLPYTRSRVDGPSETQSAPALRDSLTLRETWTGCSASPRTQPATRTLARPRAIVGAVGRRLSTFQALLCPQPALLRCLSARSASNMAPNGTTTRADPQFPISGALQAEMGVGQGAAKIDVWSVFSPMAGHVPKGQLGPRQACHAGPDARALDRL